MAFTNEQRLAEFRFWLDSSYVFIPQTKVPRDRYFSVVAQILSKYPNPTAQDLADFLADYTDPKARRMVQKAWFDFWESRADVGDHFPQMPD